MSRTPRRQQWTDEACYHVMNRGLFPEFSRIASPAYPKTSVDLRPSAPIESRQHGVYSLYREKDEREESRRGIEDGISPLMVARAHHRRPPVTRCHGDPNSIDNGQPAGNGLCQMPDPQRSGSTDRSSRARLPFTAPMVVRLLNPDDRTPDVGSSKHGCVHQCTDTGKMPRKLPFRATFWRARNAFRAEDVALQIVQGQSDWTSCLAGPGV